MDVQQVQMALADGFVMLAHLLHKPGEEWDVMVGMIIRECFEVIVPAV